MQLRISQYIGSYRSFQPNAPSTNDPGVVVSLYYESLCPYCKSWITDELIPSFQKLQQYMTVEFIPYGNAHVSGSSLLCRLKHIFRII